MLEAEATLRSWDKPLFQSGVWRGFTMVVMVRTLGFEGCIGVQQAARTIACGKAQSYGSL